MVCIIIDYIFYLLAIKSMKYNKDIIEETHYFIKLVELGSYTAVKNDCHVNLNTIKNKISRLEKYLETPLTKNVKNQVSATNFGMEYYNSCNKSYKQLENVVNKVKSDSKSVTSTLRILGAHAFMNIAVDHILPNLKEHFNQFVLNTYPFYEWTTSKHDLDQYNIIQMHSQNIQYLDLDQWIICHRIDLDTTPS